ncbi:MAG: nucleoside triphosphate pyrophosphohydrolase [Ignavibacteria bacterium]|nr:nucleoside triphosphate pyrophosphohydrolase [Ignavibacteria bacterium]
MSKERFNELENTVRKLRKECPWDKIQTNDSIKAATLEETYEVLEAIDQKDYDELKKELGDLLLHIVFHSVIAEESNKFTLSEVIEGITEKLIRRHPHVFGNAEVEDHHEVKRNWERIKLQEGRESILDGVPRELPALLRAYRLQEKASKIGFEWKSKEEAFQKILEEINELKEIEKSSDFSKLQSEIGDLLFAIVNYARMIGVNCEDALRICNEKFISRFKFVEKNLKEQSNPITDASLSEMLELWKIAKQRYP